MAYLPIKKLLDEYFTKEEVQIACEKIDEPTSYNKPKLIKIIIKEWENHGLDKYDLFGILDKKILSRICQAYNIDHIGNKTVLLKKIKKRKLLDDDKRKLKITLSGGGVIGVLIILITFIDFGIGTFDFIDNRWSPFTDNTDEYSDIEVNSENIFLKTALLTIDTLEKYVIFLEEEIGKTKDGLEKSRLGNLKDKIELGNLEYKKQNYENANGYYEQAEKIEPANPDALDGYGLTLGLLDRFKESIEVYDRLLVIKPGYYVALVNNAWSYSMIKNYEKSLEILNLLEKENKNDSIVISHKCWVVGKLIMHEDIMNYCKKALINDSEDIRAIKTYSLELSATGEFEKALPFHERLYSMYPNDIATVINYANTLSGVGKINESLELYDKILEQFPGQYAALNNKQKLCTEHSELICGTI